MSKSHSNRIKQALRDRGIPGVSSPQGSVLVHTQDKICWESCRHYNKELDWCRQKLESEPMGCRGGTVYVHVTNNLEFS